MREEFEVYARGRNLADITISQRVYALKRIERAYDIDLDEEYRRDGLESLLNQFSYSVIDQRSGAPNPSKMDIDNEKLLTHLRWYRSHITDYLRFCGGETFPIDEIQQAVADELIDEVVGKTFALERDLQFALRLNLDQLEKGLKIIDGGSERRVDAGFIDILARDHNNILTVIELKAETSRPDAIAQILAYMGALSAETSEQVRGLLVAGDHHPRVILAARAVQNLTLKKYRYRFEFE